jgi:5'-3' exonuclease
MVRSEALPTESVQVHLVDGTFELFRAYYGAPSAVAADGKEVGAVRGLLRSLYRLLGDPGVTHVACAFDHVIESFRNDLYPGYKTGEGIEAALWQQFELAETASRALGIVTWPMIEFEADDALATACERFRVLPEVSRVVICSPDKDLTQCIADHVVVAWDRVRDRKLDRDGVVAKFGVPPESIPDYLALVGDAADGLPGIPRWGAKSSATVLARYGHIEQIPAAASAWGIPVRGASALAENLQTNLQDALLFRRLATLRYDVPLAEDLQALRYRGPDRAALADLCARIGDLGFYERVCREQTAADGGSP